MTSARPTAISSTRRRTPDNHPPHSHRLIILPLANAMYRWAVAVRTTTSFGIPTDQAHRCPSPSPLFASQFKVAAVAEDRHAAVSVASIAPPLTLLDLSAALSDQDHPSAYWCGPVLQVRLRALFLLDVVPDRWRPGAQVRARRRRRMRVSPCCSPLVLVALSLSDPKR